MRFPTAMHRCMPCLCALTCAALACVMPAACTTHGTGVQIRNDTPLTLDVAVLGRDTLGSGYQERDMLQLDPHTGERSVRNASLALAPGATHLFDDAPNAHDGATTLVMVAQAGATPWMAWSVRQTAASTDATRPDASMSIVFGDGGYGIRPATAADALEVQSIHQAAGTALSRAIRDWQTHLDAWRFAHAK